MSVAEITKIIFSNPKVTDNIIKGLKLDKAQTDHVTTIGRGGAIRVPFKCDNSNSNFINNITKITKIENYNIICFVPKSKNITSGTIFPVDKDLTEQEILDNLIIKDKNCDTTVHRIVRVNINKQNSLVVKIEFNGI